MSRGNLLLLGLGGVSLLAGLTGALVLLGIGLPVATPRMAAGHGVLMVFGFLGTMISLERAVALGRLWAFLSPLVTGLGGVSLLVGAPIGLAAALLLVGGIAFVTMYVRFERLQPALHIHVQALAALAWPIAVLLWLADRPVSGIVPWLAALLVLIIAGERLELSRLGRVHGRAQLMLIVAAAVFLVGVTTTVWAFDTGVRIAGVGLIMLAGWLASHDLARHTVHMTGVTRFIAVCLLVGYAWLAVGGGLWLAAGATATMALYDARIHALFLGFVMSMVFGHAPVIIPAVLSVPLPYHRRFYSHLVLLHAGLLLRIVGGDMLGIRMLWQVGGTLNVIAVLLFVGSSGVAVLAGMKARSRTEARHASTNLGPPSRERRSSLAQ